MGFVVYFRMGIPLTELDHISPIISGNYEVYQISVTKNHVIKKSSNYSVSITM